MKINKSISALGLFVLASSIHLGAQMIVNPGDLILGFSDPTNPPGAGELVVDVGSANSFASATSSFAVNQLAVADLNSVYGADASNGNVSWTIFGGNGATALGGTPGSAAYGLWLSSPVAVLNDGRSSAQSGPSGNIAAFIGALNGAPSGSLSSSQATQSLSYDSLLTGGTFGYGSTNTQATAAGTTTLTLYELMNTGVHGSTNTPGIDLGTFTLSGSGLTFAPIGSGQVGAGSASLVNLSTRAQVGTGANILIPGFEIGGTGTETLLIRADGPALSQFGVQGVLAQPSLTVFDSTGTPVASNAGWGTNPNPSLVSNAAISAGAFPLEAGSADCALVVSLPNGSYTAEVSGVGGTTGVALAEIYEISSIGTNLINISTRAQVGTGANVVITGFVVAGSGTESLLLRGDGPSLTQFGVPGALAATSLTVFDSSGTAIDSNTGWGTNASPSLISNAASSVGAFPFASGSADSAEIANLTPGAYTVQISGVGAATGVVLAEAYEIP
jgi:hypothetical protein